MTEPSIEDIVARLEADLFTVTQDDIRALIASWRERGEALQDIAKFSPSARARRTAERALKDKP
jgi:hypothetical protein